MSGARVVIKGKGLELSKLDKVFYPETGFTKGDVINYLRAIAPVLLPHLKDRPTTLKRYPDGVEGPYFYEKECPKHRPAWVRTAAITRKRDDHDVNYCVLGTEPALVWAANLGNLELHTSLALRRNVHRPRSLVFDLDPGEPAGVLECAGIALALRSRFARDGLESFVKTSGSKGLQMFVPLNSGVTYDDTKAFARALARELEQERPQEIISKPSRAERRGKVFVDWSQNDTHKTTVCVYSLRAKARPTVSAPLVWEEVEEALDSSDAAGLRFEASEVLDRVARHGDLFAPVLNLKQKLPSG